MRWNSSTCVAEDRQRLRRAQRRQHDAEAERRRERQQHRRHQRQRGEARPAPVALPGEIRDEHRLDHQRQRPQLMAVGPQKVRQRDQRQRDQRQPARLAARERVQRQQLDAERDHREHVGAQDHPPLQRPQRQHPQHVEARPLPERRRPARDQQERGDPADGGRGAQTRPAGDAEDRPHHRLERRVLLIQRIVGERVAERVDRRPVPGLQRQPRRRQVPRQVHRHHADERQRHPGDDEQRPHHPGERRLLRVGGRRGGRRRCGHEPIDYRLERRVRGQNLNWRSGSRCSGPGRRLLRLASGS